MIQTVPGQMESVRVVEKRFSVENDEELADNMELGGTEFRGSGKSNC